MVHSLASTKDHAMKLKGVLALGMMMLLAAGCDAHLSISGGDAAQRPEAGSADGRAADAGAPTDLDLRPTTESGAVVDSSGVSDGEAADSGKVLDAGLAEMGSSDVGSSDVGSSDVGSSDVGSSDVGSPGDVGVPPSFPTEGKLTAYVVPVRAKPAYLASYIDANFGTKVTRVTDKAAFGVSTDIVTHNYPKAQPWNSDDSLIYINAGRTLLSGTTYKKVGNVSSGGEIRWSNTTPLRMWTVENNGRTINRLTVVPGTPYATTKTTLTTLSEFDSLYMGPWEGNQDDNDKYLAVLGKKGTTATAVVWDLALNVEVSRKLLPQAFDSIDWISISPSGKYLVVQTNGSGTNIYNRDFTGFRQLIPGDGHADMGYDMAGKECIVHGKWFPHPIHVQIWSTPLDGSAPTLQFNNQMYKDWSGDHVSMRARGRKGWVYMSVNENATGANKIEKHAFSLKLDGSGTTAGAERVNQWVHTYSSSASYYHNAFAVPNRNGTKVMFASDWENASGEANSYIVEMP
jgi:hypothetical protein